MKYSERLRVWESRFGRELGWDVELEGKRVAVLSGARGVDMFWVSYEMTPMAEDPVVGARVLERSFWLEKGSGLVYRNHVIKSVVANSVVVGLREVGSRRMAFRRLYADVEGPRCWDRLVLTLRRVWRLMRGDWG